MKGGKILFYILWEDIYADESHRFCNPRSLTFYTMMSLHGKFRFALSGTPLNNYQSDLFTQLKWIGGCVDITNAKEFSYEYYIKTQLFKCIKIMNYEDAEIKLPEVISRVEVLELTGKEKEIYEYYQNATRNVYNDFMIGSNNFASVLTMFLRLRQVCICPYTVLDKSARKYKEVKNDDYKIAQDVLDKLSGGLVSWLNNVNGTAGMYSTKINRIMEIIRHEIPKNESVVVFTNFKKVIDVIIERFKKEKITYTIFDGDVKSADREKSIEMFRKNKAQVFLATLKAGSESLNLSDISHNVILSEIWYCPRAEDQAKSRVHRYGQTHVVNFWKLIFKDSIDERIEQICQGKRELAELFMGRGTKTTSRLNASLLGQILNVKK
jgi:SNF2 family DNA or RNA helicase